jgi:hypothetical protein
MTLVSSPREIISHLDDEVSAPHHIERNNKGMCRCSECGKFMGYFSLRIHMIEKHFKYFCMPCEHFFDSEEQFTGHECTKLADEDVEVLGLQ